MDDSLGKKVDKWGKGGDGKKEVGAAAPPEKSWTHQTVRHILSQKMSDAVRISEEIHNGEIGFNEAAFKYSEDKAGAHGLLGDKAANELDPEFWAMWKTRPIWPASAAQVADWPRLAVARGSLRHDLAQKGASGEPAGRGLSRLVFHIGVTKGVWEFKTTLCDEGSADAIPFDWNRFKYIAANAQPSNYAMDENRVFVIEQGGVYDSTGTGKLTRYSMDDLVTRPQLTPTNPN